MTCYSCETLFCYLCELYSLLRDAKEFITKNPYEHFWAPIGKTLMACQGMLFAGIKGTLSG
jgi:hypothetical protein